MTLYTIQSDESYKHLLHDGSISGTRETVMEPYFLPAYDWMRKEMAKRVGEPPKPDVYPIWAWHTINGKQKRPDMRHFQSEISSAGADGLWLLTLDVPEREVLLSDFLLWHSVLNREYLALSEDEWDTHENCSQAEKETSWEQIFQLDIPQNEWIGYGPKNIQATFWEIRLKMLVKAEHFKRRRKAE